MTEQFIREIRFTIFYYFREMNFIRANNQMLISRGFSGTTGLYGRLSATQGSTMGHNTKEYNRRKKTNRWRYRQIHKYGYKLYHITKIGIFFLEPRVTFLTLTFVIYDQNWP